jgi:hypothetical protein
LIDKLQMAIDAPTNNEGETPRAKLPQFFNTWARSAWTDLLDKLPDEDATAEISDPAQEEFRMKVRSGLLSMVHLAYGYDADGERREIERRPLINWCRRFAKDKRWEDIRGMWIWSRYDESQFRVAIRVEAFAQAGQKSLFDGVSQNKFGRLCELYGVGTTKEGDSPVKVCGHRAVELDGAFLSELVTPEETNARFADYSPAHARTREDNGKTANG